MVGRARGFVEARNLAGDGSFHARTYRVKDNSPLAIYPGDPVVLVSGNTVHRLPAAATANSLPVLGIVRSVLNSDGRPLTHSLPSNPPALAASTAGWVQVNDNPDQTYLVDLDATANSTFIGQFCEATAGSPVSAAGRSGFSIQVGGASNTAANTLPFNVIGIGYNELGQPNQMVSGVWASDVEVRIANHAWRTLAVSALQGPHAS